DRRAFETDDGRERVAELLQDERRNSFGVVDRGFRQLEGVGEIAGRGIDLRDLERHLDVSCRHLLRWSGDAAEAHLRAVRELHDRRLLETLFRLHAKEVLLARAGIEELDRNRLRERAVRGIVALLLLAILLGLFGVLR